jgi:hypothetical protein
MERLLSIATVPVRPVRDVRHRRLDCQQSNPGRAAIIEREHDVAQLEKRRQGKVLMALVDIQLDQTNGSVMNKSKKFALVAVAFTMYGLHKLFVVFHDSQTGCIQFRTHRTCSFENAANFQNLLNLELLFACGWVAGAAVCWMVAAQAREKRR